MSTRWDRMADRAARRSVRAFGKPAELILADGSRIPVQIVESKTSSSETSESKRVMRMHSFAHSAVFQTRLLPEDWRSVRLDLDGVLYRLADREEMDAGDAAFELAKETPNPEENPLNKNLLNI